MDLSTKKLGIAVVGIGEYATTQIMPALKQTSYCYLAGIVCDDRYKAKIWQEEFHIPDENIYSYEDFDNIIDNPAIDIVYILLPNSMHASYTIRAAQAGKHIICDKPMAIDTKECGAMIQAIEQAGVRFSMGYRLHFDPYHIELMRIGQQEKLGKIKKLILKNSMEIDESGGWRLKKKMAGGGALYNNGIYCIQAALYLTGKFPIAVEASFTNTTDHDKFKEVEEGIEWTLFFEDGIEAICESHYTKEQDLIGVETEHGWFQLEPAFAYKGLSGSSSEGEINFDPFNQQAAQMDDFAICILTNSESRVPAEMGMRDVEIMEAIYKAATTKQRVHLDLEKYAYVPIY